MKKQVFLLFEFTSIVNLLAVLAVVKGLASVENVALALMATLASGAGVLLWWNSKRKPEVHDKPEKTSSALVWLLAPFAASAIVAVVQALHERWDIGDTIG